MKTTNHMDVDRIVSLLVTKHPEISAEDAGTLLREWVALITENLLREESVETEPFGTFDCSPVSDGDPA
ncbi:MAG: hypothetical protein PHS71_06440, partial [Proteiniphilum sp.]|nr:hypothetical protein [Proteiniphilum sp.]